jgi:hypothetical protein
MDARGYTLKMNEQITKPVLVAVDQARINIDKMTRRIKKRFGPVLVKLTKEEEENLKRTDLGDDT